MLGTPPAFVLSQDQTLKKWYLKLFSELKIDLLNNLLLAFITQEFSLAVFSLTLKQSIYCPRCLVCLFVIQFTRYRVVLASRLGTRLVYHRMSRLSRAFFSFFRVFSRFVLPPACFPSVHRKACLYYHASAPLSSTFYNFSPSFLVTFPWRDYHAGRPALVSRSSCNVTRK